MSEQEVEDVVVAVRRVLLQRDVRDVDVRFDGGVTVRVDLESDRIALEPSDELTITIRVNGGARNRFVAAAP